MKEPLAVVLLFNRTNRSISQTNANFLNLGSFYYLKHEGAKYLNMLNKAKRPWKYGHIPLKTLSQWFLIAESN